MAWYNPQRVEYTPNAKVIESAGAIGGYLQDKAMLDYKQRLQDLENKRLADEFEFRKQRATTQDDQFNKTFQQNQDNIAFNQSMKVADFENDDYWKDKTFKQQEDTLKAKQTEEDSQKYVKGLYLAKQDPEFANSIGATTEKTIMATPKTYTKPNPFIEQITGMSTPQQTDFLPQEQMSVPTYEKKTEYNPVIMRILGGSGISMPKNESNSEYITLSKMLDKETDPQKIEQIKARMTKLSQADMGSKLITWNALEGQANQFANNIGVTNMYALANVNMSELKPEQQAEASIIGDKMYDVYKADNKQIAKNIADFEAEYTQLSHAKDALQQVGDIRFADEAVKDYFSNYFGLSKEEMQSTEATQALQSALNIAIRVDNGASVTNNELERKVAETATKYQHKDKVLMGIKNMARRKIGTLEGLKRLQPVAFNLKYGAVLDNYKKLYDVLDAGTTNNTWTSITKTTNNTTITVDDYSSYGISFE